MTDAYRTPDERFEGLPGFDLPARYRQSAYRADRLAPRRPRPYEAPFPEAAAKAGAKAFPALIPQRPDAPGAAAGGRTAIIAEWLGV